MFVITGNPGVGKHTLAKRLAGKFEILDLNRVAIDNKVYKKTRDALDVDVVKLGKIVKKMIRSDTLAVGHLAPYVVPPKQVRFVIVLRKSPYQLIPVYKKRRYAKKKMFENLGSEILGVTAYDAITRFGKKKTFQIDTTNLSVQKTADRIKLVFKKKFKGDRVDWLALVAQKNDLARFFPSK